MASYLCPSCHHALQWIASQEYSCSYCHQIYRKMETCHQCGKPVERLQACGSVSYFCNHGDGLLSKQQVDVDFVL